MHNLQITTTINSGMIEVGETTPSGESPTILLTELDYPVEYRTSNKMYAHPNDYELSNTPVIPKFFYYTHMGHRRIFARLPIALGKNKYTSATFVVDTGACGFFYLNKPVMTILLEHERMKEDDVGNPFIEIDVGGTSKKCPVLQVPQQHLPGNIIGLPVLVMCGFSIAPTLNCERDQSNVATGLFDMGLKMI